MRPYAVARRSNGHSGGGEDKRKEGVGGRSVEREDKEGGTKAGGHTRLCAMPPSSHTAFHPDFQDTHRERREIWRQSNEGGGKKQGSSSPFPTAPSFPPSPLWSVGRRRRSLPSSLSPASCCASQSRLPGRRKGRRRSEIGKDEEGKREMVLFPLSSLIPISALLSSSSASRPPHSSSFPLFEGGRERGCNKSRAGAGGP